MRKAKDVYKRQAYGIQTHSCHTRTGRKGQKRNYQKIQCNSPQWIFEKMVQKDGKCHPLDYRSHPQCFPLTDHRRIPAVGSLSSTRRILLPSYPLFLLPKLLRQPYSQHRSIGKLQTAGTQKIWRVCRQQKKRQCHGRKQVIGSSQTACQKSTEHHKDSPEHRRRKSGNRPVKQKHRAGRSSGSPVPQTQHTKSLIKSHPNQ